MEDQNRIKDIVDSVTKLAEVVPVYQDLIQPGIKQLGKSIETVAKAVNVALTPVGVFVWGYEKIKEHILTKVSEKLKNVPLEEIAPPKANVVGPAVEALRFIGPEETLRELYTNLLATSIDARTASLAHPSFVEIIKQMTPDEARLMKLFTRDGAFPVLNVSAKVKTGSGGGITAFRNFSLLGEEANCEHKQLTPTYLDNLCRLGLINIPENGSYTNKTVYEPLKSHLTLKAIISAVNNVPDREAEIEEKIILITSLGRQFLKACVDDHDTIRMNNIPIL